MIKLSTPIKNFTHDDITQHFHKDHKALDIVENSRKSIYGLPLCAMEDCKITRTHRTDGFTPGSRAKLKDGYGLDMTGLETGLKYRYWHVQPYLPVSKGDVVKRGQIVAYMGNAGTVRVGGKDVPIEERTEKPYRGTHLHLMVWKNNKLTDPLPLIDFYQLPTYGASAILKAAYATVVKMVRAVGN